MQVRFKDEFSEVEWKNKDDPHCKQCLKRLKEQGKTHRCARCRTWFARSDFANTKTTHLSKLICDECKNKRPERRCFRCEKDKPEKDFPATTWKQVLEQRICMECADGRHCSNCDARGDVSRFGAIEWDKPDKVRRCKECVPKRCCKCRKTKMKSVYSKAQWLVVEGKAVCNDCDRKRCGKCQKEKGFKSFTANMWEADHGSVDILCRDCCAGGRTVGMWTCANRRCQQQKPLSAFSKARAEHNEKVWRNSRVCDECKERRAQELAEMNRKSTEHVIKKRRQS
jgi:hypothetical protein